MKPITVMVVDDQTTLRRELARRLSESTGVRVVGQASDAMETLVLAQKFMPDVILMDDAMPWIDGIEATRQIKSVVPQVSIILMSLEGEGRLAYRDKAYVAGVTSIISKREPYSRLLAEVRDIGKN